MKVTVLSILCFLFCLNIFGQTAANFTADEVVQVEELFLARDDGNGQAGEVTENFFINDIPIYCVVQLNSLKPAAVKMILFAVKVNGVKPETKVITTIYKTNGKQNRVYFTGTPDKVWTAGFYRIDIFVDDKTTKSLEFEIKKTPQQIEKEKQPVPKPKNTAKKFKKT